MTAREVKQYGIHWLFGWSRVTASPETLRGELALTPQMMRLAWTHRREVELRCWHEVATRLALMFYNGDPAKYAEYLDIVTREWSFAQAARALHSAREASNKSSNPHVKFREAVRRHRSALHETLFTKDEAASGSETTSAPKLVRIHDFTGPAQTTATHEKARSRAALRKVLAEPKKIAGPTTRHACDELFADLYAESPWLAPALTYLWRAAIARVEQSGSFGLLPVVLSGPPGCGKTHLAERIGKLSGCVPLRVDMTGATSSFAIAGADYMWSTSGPGRPIQHIADHGIANPVVVLDELDKRGISTNGGDAADALLPMLEPTTSEAYQSPYLEAPVNLSHISWIICVNDISHLPQPMLDRSRVLTCDMPQGAHLSALVRRVLGEEVDPQVVELATKAVKRGRSLRWLRRLSVQLQAALDAPMLM
ncbi:AAA family ATPase [Sulfitobacter sp. R86518]|uniref:AAA family ATPase n=1 Tax=Sulfitobacter sp. R86518 TaxID=3093858 RepID=UPI0036D7968A